MWMECEKIIYNKKILSSIVVLFLLMIGVFIYSIWQKQVHWETWNETTYEEVYIQGEKEYISNFHESLEEILQQVDSMGMISIFTQMDSYSMSNLEKTKEDFITLLRIEPRLVKNVFLSEFFEDKGIHIFVAIAGILLAFSMLDESRQGLRGMIYATVNGRGTYVIFKIFALFTWTGIVSMFFYCGLLCISSICFDGNIVEYWAFPIQSLSIFGNVPWMLEFGDFLLLYLFVRWMTVFLISLLVWVILFCIDQMLIGIGLVGGISVISLGAYLLIDSTHVWNVLHYCNPWYLILGNDFFTEYRNLNLFSQVINKNVVIAIWVCLILFVLSIVSVFVGIKRYPCESPKNKVIKFGGTLLRKIRQWESCCVSRLSLLGMEYYKVLISQKGIFVFIVMVIVFIYQADFNAVQFATSQKMYFSFMEKYAGIPNELSEQELLEMEAMLNEVERKYMSDMVRYEAGEITQDEKIGSSIWYQSYEQDRIFFAQIQEQTQYLERLKEEKGIEGWYVNLYSYNNLISRSNIFMNVLLHFGIMLICIGEFSVEAKSGMMPLIRGSVMGEKELFIKKIKVACSVSIFLFLLLSGLEVGTVAYIYGLTSWEAPVQSIVKLANVPISCSIGVFFTLLFMVRGLGIIVFASTICLISRRMGRH